MNRKEAQLFIMDVANGMEARAAYADTLAPISQEIDAEELYGRKYTFFSELFVDMLATRIKRNIDTESTVDTTDDRNP